MKAWYTPGCFSGSACPGKLPYSAEASGPTPAGVAPEETWATAPTAAKLTETARTRKIDTPIIVPFITTCRRSPSGEPVARLAWLQGCHFHFNTFPVKFQTDMDSRQGGFILRDVTLTDVQTSKCVPACPPLGTRCDAPSQEFRSSGKPDL